MQSTLTGELVIKEYCSFGCGRKVREVSSQAYMNYQKKLALKRKSQLSAVRCPYCEIDFVETVHRLPKEKVERLKKKWVKTL